MRHIEGFFDNGCDGGLFFRAWQPDASPRAVVILVHGLAEHSGRYESVISYMLGQELAVWTYDQRGHGRSPGQRCYVNNFGDLTGDLAKFIAKVKSDHPDTPLFLLGHSLGALEVADYAAGGANGIHGAILSAVPLCIHHNTPELLVKLASVFSKLAPRLGLQKLPSDTISQDKSVVQDYVNDPLVYTGKIPARMGAEMFRSVKELSAKLPTINLPILVLHGGEDRMALPDGGKLLFERASSVDKELHIFPECYHEIFNEACGDTALAVTGKWLNRQLSPIPASA